MASRLKNAWWNTRAGIFAIVVHVLLFLLIGWSFNWSTPEKAGAGNPIQATVLSEDRIQEAVDALKQQEAEKQQQELDAKQRLEELEQQKVEEEQEIQKLVEQREEAKRQEQEALKQKELAEVQKKEAEQERLVEEKRSKLAAEKRKKEEAERKEREAEQKRLDEEKREKEAAEKQRKAEEQRKKDEADKQRKAEEKRKAQEAEKQRKAEEARKREAEAAKRREAELTARIQAERDEREAGQALGFATGAIRDAVSRYFSTQAGWVGLEAVVRVKVQPSGHVTSARVIRSSGNPYFDAEAERAVQKASPLPIPTEPRFYPYINEFDFRFSPN